MLEDCASWFEDNEQHSFARPILLRVEEYVLEFTQEAARYSLLRVIHKMKTPSLAGVFQTSALESDKELSQVNSCTAAHPTITSFPFETKHSFHKTMV